MSGNKILKKDFLKIDNESADVLVPEDFKLVSRDIFLRIVQQKHLKVKMMNSTI